MPGQAAPLIGSVIVDHQENNALRYYVVNPEGLQPISAVVAAILRANNAYGLIEPPALTPDQVGKAPKSDVVAVDSYPSNPLQVLDPATEPVTCGQWVKLAGAPTSSLTLLAGPSVPVASDAKTLTPPGGAAKVLLPKELGSLCRSPGSSPCRPPKSRSSGSLIWVCGTAWKRRRTRPRPRPKPSD